MNRTEISSNSLSKLLLIEVKMSHGGIIIVVSLGVNKYANQMPPPTLLVRSK